MIGGYVYRNPDPEIDALLRDRLPAGCRRIDVWDNGYFFCTGSLESAQAPFAVSSELIVLSEDLLVTPDSSGEYRLAAWEADFCESFRKRNTDAFQSVQNDFRMAVAAGAGGDRSLYLVSQRAGSGRIYYHKRDDGIVFSSDLRFLYGIVPFDISRRGIYAILKYGAVPEPLTISSNISAVPAAHYLKYEIASGQESARPYFKLRFSEEVRRRGRGVEPDLGPVREALKKSAGFLGRSSTALLLSGGIDSSLYGCYMNQAGGEPPQAFYCAFGASDPEYPYASAIAGRIGVKLQVAGMEKRDALSALDDVVRLTDHPFSDFSSLPIAFLLQYIREHASGRPLVIECNGGDDCFGFPALQHEAKFRLKHSVPRAAKKWISSRLRRSPRWKWEAGGGASARIAALADVHESDPLSYFLVLAPVHYLSLDVPAEWDETLQGLIERTSANCGAGYTRLGYEAKTTIRQLLYVNSARWAAKALSVGESLGLRVMYPYIWQDVLVEQGKLPWSAKVHDGIVKWPLKKLLEEFMPGEFIYRKKSGFVPPFVGWLTDPEFNGRVREAVLRTDGFVTEVIPARVIDELLTDAFKGRQLRSPVLNMLWGAIFAESWIQHHRHPPHEGRNKEGARGLQPARFRTD